MKSNLINTVISLTLFLTACFAMSDAYADAYLYGNSVAKDYFGNDRTSKYFIYVHKSAFDDFNKKYSDGENRPDKIGFLGSAIEEKKGIHKYYGRLNGEKKRFGVYKVQKKTADGVLKDLVLESKEQAEAFCNDLLALANAQGKRKSDVIYVYDYYGTIERIIAVGYQIAYDTGSKLAEDKVSSTPARKYVFCPHPWDKKKWKLEPGIADENENTGIRKVDFRESEYYDVTCMNAPPDSLPVTFTLNSKTGQWSDQESGKSYPVNSDKPTLHQLNEQIGAKFCPMS